MGGGCVVVAMVVVDRAQPHANDLPSVSGDGFAVVESLDVKG